MEPALGGSRSQPGQGRQRVETEHDRSEAQPSHGRPRADSAQDGVGAWSGWGEPQAESARSGEPAQGGARRRSGRGGAGARARRGGRGRRGSDWLPDGPDAETPADAGPPADPESVARAICLRLLTMAPKTRAQLAEALRKRDVPDEAAEAVLDRFSELGLINDEAFAEAWVDSRHHGRGLAKRALAAELRHRGVDSDTVNEAVDRLDSDQELETARRLVERKLASTRNLDPKVRTRRLAGMLARKGYPPGLSFRVIREALEQEGVEVEEDFS
ncbi:recombination regulator RecX [Nonomuraea sp. NPDC005983]|uniref:recombination regulator RecX n=1 Tax=Nonomuraea sp. NPDC005983 TaxID=3155595 RepID=UPI0033B15988